MAYGLPEEVLEPLLFHDMSPVQSWPLFCAIHFQNKYPLLNYPSLSDLPRRTAPFHLQRYRHCLKKEYNRRYTPSQPDSWRYIIRCLSLKKHIYYLLLHSLE